MFFFFFFNKKRKLCRAMLFELARSIPALHVKTENLTNLLQK